MPDFGSRLLRIGHAPSEVLLVAPDHAVSAGELATLAQAAPIGLSVNSQAALQLRSAADLIRALLLLDGRIEGLALLPATLDSDQVSNLARQHGLTDIIKCLPAIGPPRPRGPSVSTSWLLKTSGTTGSPKAITHSFASLARTVRARPADAVRPNSDQPNASGLPIWGLLFDPARFAGLQVVLQALLGGGRLICPDPLAPLGDRLAMLAMHGCTHLSATPSLWRRILMAPEARQLALSQITLGGEIADQALLNNLARAFPAARITHIYASTEAGVGFAVKDGIAGFPARWLDEPDGPTELRITDGILWVRPKGHQSDAPNECDAAGYLRTGDRVRLENERVLFLGREGGAINIGGIKVQPETVETVLRAHPGVADCRISSRSSAVVGAILVAEVVPAPGSPEDLRLQLKLWCKERLPREAQPAMITLLADLPTTAAGKLARHAPEEAA